MRLELAKKYIAGRGIEIGGLHNPLPVLPGAKVIYIDRLPPDQAHPDVTGKVQNVVIDDAETLRGVMYHSCDFIIANHVLEHCHDPVSTIKCWSKRRSGRKSSGWTATTCSCAGCTFASRPTWRSTGRWCSQAGMTLWRTARLKA